MSNEPLAWKYRNVTWIPRVIIPLGLLSLIVGVNLFGHGLFAFVGAIFLTWVIPGFVIAHMMGRKGYIDCEYSETQDSVSGV